MKILAFTLCLLLAPGGVRAAGCPGGICPDQGQGQWQGQGQASRPQLQAPRRQVASHPAVCRIVSYARNEEDWGSGTLIEPDLVLSCYHIFPAGANRIEIRFSGGKYLGRLLAVDEDADLAVVEIRPATITPVVVSQNDPKPGDSVTTGGFGRPTDGFWLNRRRVLGYATADHRGSAKGVRVHDTPDRLASNTMMLTGRNREGDSGGPVFNGAGELVGVAWGSDEQTVSATSCLKIRGFLARIRARIAERRRIRGQQRGGGGVATKPAPEAETLETLDPGISMPPVPLVPIEKAALPVITVKPNPDQKEPVVLADQLGAIRQLVEGLGGRVDKLAQGRETESVGVLSRVDQLAESIEKLGQPPTAAAPAAPLLSVPASLLSPAAVTALAAATGFSPLLLWGAFFAVRTLRRRRKGRSVDSVAKMPEFDRLDISQQATPQQPTPQPIHLGWDDIPRVRSTRNRYVRVEQTDAVGEAYKEAIARWAETNPRTAGLMRAVDELAQNIHHGKQVDARMQPQVDRPQIDPQTQGVV